MKSTQDFISCAGAFATLWLLLVATGIVVDLGEDPRLLLGHGLLNAVVMFVVDLLACVVMFCGIQSLRAWGIENGQRATHLVSLIWLGLAGFLTLLNMTTAAAVLGHAMFWRPTP